MNLLDCYHGEDWEIFFNATTPLQNSHRNYRETMYGPSATPDWRFANGLLYMGTEQMYISNQNRYGEYEVCLDASFSSAKMGFWRSDYNPAAGMFLEYLPMGIELFISKRDGISLSCYSYILPGDYDPIKGKDFIPVGQELQEFKTRLDEDTESFHLSPPLRFKKLDVYDNIRVNVVVVENVDGAVFGVPGSGRSTVGVYVNGNLLCDIFVTWIGSALLTLEGGCYKSIKFRHQWRKSSMKEDRWW